MDASNLHDLLRRLPIPEDAYSLDGSLRDESYVLEATGSGWTVFYFERGRRTEERRFSSEENACQELLRRLRSVFMRD